MPSSITLLPSNQPSSPTTMTTNSHFVAYWKADGNTNDVYGINNGTFVGTAKYTTGYGNLGQAFLLDGSNYIDIPATDRLDIGASESGMSVSLWLKATTTGPLIEWGDGNDPGFRLWLWPHISSFHVGLHTFVQPNNYFYNTWRHVVFSYDRMSGYGNFYSDGNLVSSHSFGTNLRLATQYSHLTFGHRINHYYEYFTGSLGEISLWNRPLNDTEIQTLYTSSLQSSSPTATLIPTVMSTAPRCTCESVLCGRCMTGCAINSGNHGIYCPESSNFCWCNILGTTCTSVGVFFWTYDL